MVADDTVELLLAADEMEHRTLAASGAGDHASGRRRSAAATILIVEDEPDLRDVVADILDDLGYRTLVAASGAAALKLLASDRDIDLVFTDLVMPGPIDGLMLAEEARRLYPGIRIVFTSGYAEHPALGSRLPGPGEILLRKPYHRAELAATIARAFGRSG